MIVMEGFTPKQREIIEHTLQWLERRHFYPIVDMSEISTGQLTAAYVRALEAEVARAQADAAGESHP